MSLALRVAVLGLALALAAPAYAGPERFPVLAKLPKKSQEGMAAMIEWQRSLVDLKQSEVESKLGKPEKTRDLPANPVTGKPMHMLVYRLTRLSELQLTIHQGKVAAVATILLPSSNENGPIGD